MTEPLNLAIFTIKIFSIKTTTLNNLIDVVKQVTWTIVATKNSLFSETLEYTTVLRDPSVDAYIPLSDLTESKVVEFIINNDQRLLGIKSYLQNCLDVEIAKNSLNNVPLPWLPTTILELVPLP